MATKTVLIVCTSNDKYASPDTPLTGSWMEEVAAPYFIFKANGYAVTIASIKGGKVGKRSRVVGVSLSRMMASKTGCQ